MLYRGEEKVPFNRLTSKSCPAESQLGEGGEEEEARTERIKEREKQIHKHIRLSGLLWKEKKRTSRC